MNDRESTRAGAGASKTATDEAGELLFECELSDPPEKVWKALTTPKLVAAWLSAIDFRAEVGARFRVEDESVGTVECTVLAIEPLREIRYAWRERGPDVRESVVTFSLMPTIQRGTLLRIVHERAPQNAVHVPSARAAAGAVCAQTRSWRWAA